MIVFLWVLNYKYIKYIFLFIFHTFTEVLFLVQELFLVMEYFHSTQ